MSGSIPTYLLKIDEAYWNEYVRFFWKKLVVGGLYDTGTKLVMHIDTYFGMFLARFTSFRPTLFKSTGIISCFVTAAKMWSQLLDSPDARSISSFAHLECHSSALHVHLCVVGFCRSHHAFSSEHCCPQCLSSGECPSLQHLRDFRSIQTSVAISSAYSEQRSVVVGDEDAFWLPCDIVRLSHHVFVHETSVDKCGFRTVGIDDLCAGESNIGINFEFGISTVLGLAHGSHIPRDAPEPCSARHTPATSPGTAHQVPTTPRASEMEEASARQLPRPHAWRRRSEPSRRWQGYWKSRMISRHRRPQQSFARVHPVSLPEHSQRYGIGEQLSRSSNQLHSMATRTSQFHGL